MAADMLEAAVVDLAYEAGVFRVVGTDCSVDLTALAVAAQGAHPVDQGQPPGFGVTGTFAPAASTYPNGCHVCEVEVDPQTGITHIVRYTVVDDFGTVINPALLAGQVHGGITQGVGQALLEHCRYDKESGQLLTGSLVDYGLPRAGDVPFFDLTYNENWPCRNNPLGIKGAGEAGAIGAPPAVINAVVDALSPYGVVHMDMPATPEKVWRAIRGGSHERLV